MLCQKNVDMYEGKAMGINTAKKKIVGVEGNYKECEQFKKKHIQTTLSLSLVERSLLVPCTTTFLEEKGLSVYCYSRSRLRLGFAKEMSNLSAIPPLL